MNRATRRLRNRADLERDVESLTEARDGLLDVLNAILALEGGRIVIPEAIVMAATRKPVHVTHDLIGAVIRVELEGAEKPPEPPKASVIERLRRLGLKPV